MSKFYELTVGVCDPECCHSSYIEICEVRANISGFGGRKTIYMSEWGEIPDCIEKWRKEILELNLGFDVSAESPTDWEATVPMKE